MFLELIAEALQLDSYPGPKSLAEYKAAFSPQAVRKINEAIVEIWPKETDIATVLRSSKEEVSGLYVGEYQPELLIRGVLRHSLYANKILLVDPFIYPFSVREEFNPILHPEQYRTQTLRNVDMWFRLMPFIDAGIVEFIRTPADFDPKLNWESMLRQKMKFEENEDLKAIAEDYAQKQVEEYAEKESLRLLILSAPDDYLRRTFREKRLGTAEEEESYIAYIHKLRKNDPYYLDPLDKDPSTWSEYHIRTTGTSYDLAKITSNYTGSYLVTDLPPRWKEIELDRSNHGISQAEWSPMAKAFHNLNIKYLNNVELSHALRLRKEDRLQGLRTFLRQIWIAASTGNPFGEGNVKHLADELENKVRETEEEWKQIDRDLIKWIGAEAATGFLSQALIADGNAGFFAAAIATAGITTLSATALQRKGFPDKYPAAFFMDLKKTG
jgi:hypothetical protein